MGKNISERSNIRNDVKTFLASIGVPHCHIQNGDDEGLSRIIYPILVKDQQMFIIKKFLSETKGKMPIFRADFPNLNSYFPRIDQSDLSQGSVEVALCHTPTERCILGTFTIIPYAIAYFAIWLCNKFGSFLAWQQGFVPVLHLDYWFRQQK